MKTLNTTAGTAEITDVRMKRDSGYGQYKLIIDFSLADTNHTIDVHSTDSRLWDEQEDAENPAEFLLENAKHTIDGAIEEHAHTI